MKIGDSFSDEQKRTWTVTECLGRGLWGRSFLVRGDGGQERVLKVPLGPADLRDPGLSRVCREGAQEQIRLLQRGGLPHLPRLEAVVDLDDGPGLLLPRYPVSLARRLEGGMPLSSAVQLVERVTAALAGAGQIHGNLRPSNLLLNDRGEPVLTDVLTPSVAKALSALEADLPSRASWRPPGEARPAGMWDTWALCQVLWQAAMTPDGGSGTARLEPPALDLDKVAVATLKDRALARLANERTNPRFRARMADRLGAILNRGLSREREPSPPYRFVDASALLPRLQEVTALVSPAVEHVGRVLLPADTEGTGTLEGGEPVAFVVTVGCTEGVTDHEDVVCGLQLLDLDSPDDGRVPVKDATFKVSTHPSGRMRFQFTVPDLPPGRYRVRAAFTIKDSGQPPQVAEGRFEVRPPPGYVPPMEPVQTRGTPIPFRPSSPPPEPETEAETVADEPLVARKRRSPQVVAPVRLSQPVAQDPLSDADPEIEPAAPERRDRVAGRGPSSQARLPASELDALEEALSDPGAEIIEGLFPRPIAPPDDDLQPVQARAPIPVEVELEETVAHAAGQRSGSWAGEATVTESAPYRPTLQAPSASPQAYAGGPVAPGPVIAMPRPTLSPAGAVAVGVTAGPRPSMPSPGPSIPTSPDLDFDDASDPIGSWGELSGDGLDFEIEQDALPHPEGEELPSWRKRELPFDTSRIPGLDQLIALVQRDSTTALVASIIGCSALLLACMALLRAC